MIETLQLVVGVVLLVALVGAGAVSLFMAFWDPPMSRRGFYEVQHKAARECREEFEKRQQKKGEPG